MREFSLPFKPEELLAQPSDDRLWAADLPAVDDLSAGEVSAALDSLIGKVLSSQGYALAEDESFSLVFALLQAWPRLDDGVGPRIVDLLADAARRVAAEVARVKKAEKTVGTSKKEQTKMLNATRDARTASKVCIFFLRWAAERLLRKESAETVGTRRGRGRGRGGARAAGDGDGQEMSAEEAKEAAKAAERQRCGALGELVGLLGKGAMPWLWMGDPAAFQQAAQAVSDAGFLVLDNQDMLKSRETKQAAIRCIAEPLQQEGHQHSNLIVATVSKLMYGLRGAEGGATFAADVLLAAHTTALPRTFLVELPSHCNAAELTSQGAFQRGLQGFLVALSERLPHVVLANIAVLLPLLDVDCYPLRSAIVESIGSLLSAQGRKLPKGAVCGTRAGGEEDAPAGDDAAASAAGHAPGDLIPLADAEGAAPGRGAARGAGGETHFSIAEATRKDLLETLMTRSLDKSVWVRYRALQTLNHLASNTGANGLPRDQWSRVLGIATRRMQDSASMTRKASMQLTTVLISNHPYGPALQGAGDERDKAEKLLREVQARFQKLQAEEIADAEQEAAGEADHAEEADDADAEEAPKKVRRLMKKTVTDMSIQAEVDQVLADADEGGARQDERNRQREALVRMQDCYTQRLKFIEHIDAAGQRLVTLLSSRYPTDVTEAIGVVVALRQREVPAAASAFDKVLGLVWSRQSSIKDAAVDAFNSMYLEGRDTGTAVRALLQMYQSGCDGGSWTYTHLASVQELIQQAAEKEYIDAKRAIPELVTALKGPSCDMALRALTALGAAAASEAATMLPRVKEAVGPGGACCGASPAERMERARLLCQLLQRLQTCAKVTFKPEVESCLWDLSAHATRVVVEAFSQDAVPPQWFGAAQAAMDLSFDLSMSLAHHTDPIQRCPDKLWEQILSRMLCGILPKQEPAAMPEDGADGEDAAGAVVPAPQPDGGMVSGMQIGCAVFVAGHLGLRTLVLLEGLQSALKRKRLQEEDARMAEAREEKKQKKEKDKKKSKGKGKGKEEEEEGGGEAASMGQAGQEEREAEAFNEIAENGLLFGKRSLLDRVKPLIFQCMLDPTMRSDVTLRRLGALSLCKFMIISKRFCEDNLQLLFSILFPKGKNTSVLSGGDAAEVECDGASALLEDMTLRQSLLVAVGDLLFRHPNTVEPWSTRLYATLAGATDGEPEQAAQMRLTALLVLTHLVLNDMMKPRSVLLVRALWLTACPHEPTSRVARILFSELAKRTTNVIYNLLPQIITNLPNHQEAAGQVSGGAEGRVQYIMQFVEKEKHIEGLIEKLTLRLEQAANAAGGSAAAAAAAAAPAADTQAAETQLDAAADVQEGTAAASVSCLSHAIGAMNYSDRTILRLHDAIVVRKAVNTAISYHGVTRDCFMSIVEKFRKPKPGKAGAAEGAAPPEPAGGADAAAAEGGGGGRGNSAAAIAAIDAIEKLVVGLGRGRDEAKDAPPLGDGEPAAAAAADEAKAPAGGRGKGGGRGKRKAEAAGADAENPGFEDEDAARGRGGGRGRGRGRGRGSAAAERESQAAQPPARPAAPAPKPQAPPAPQQQAKPPQKGSNLDRLFGGGGGGKAPKGRGKGRGAAKRTRAGDDDEE